MVNGIAGELEALEGVDIAALVGPELVAHVGRLQRLRSRFAALTTSAVDRLEATSAHEHDGARTAPTWLTGHCGTSKGDARAQVRLAVHLRTMPVTRAAFAVGEITEAHAHVLARGVANPRTVARFAHDESMLVTLATKVSADQLAEELRRWFQLHDPDGTAPSDPADDRLFANRVGDRVKLDGDFGLETGIPLLAAIEERMSVLRQRDRRVADQNPADALRARTPGNRRAEAVSELIMAGASDAGNPRHREPLFQVLVDQLTLSTMEQRHDSVLRLADGTEIGIDLAGLWACDAMINRVVLDARGAVLDLGRTERYANREQRRALDARDRGCAIPGCDLAPERCDAHHVVFWDDVGPTDLDNLVLVCRHHHRQVHRDRLHVEMIGGRPQFSDATGRRIAPGRHRPSADAA